MIIDNILLMRQKTRGTNKGRSPLRRSVAKSITWRIIGTIDTMLISWFVTGKLILAISIGSIELVTKMVLYVIHERVWERIGWGLVKKVSNSVNEAAVTVSVNNVGYPSTDILAENSNKYK